MYKEILQELSYLWTIAVRERDEASERLQNSLAQISQLQTLFNTIFLSEEQQVLHYYHPEAKKEAISLQNCNFNHFSDDSPSRFSNAARDYEIVVLETIGGVLPENGKFLQAVIESGPLLESLLITGPIPKWNNPPDPRPVLSNNIGHSITDNWIYGGGLELGSGMLNRSFPGKMSQLSLMFLNSA